MFSKLNNRFFEFHMFLGRFDVNPPSNNSFIGIKKRKSDLIRIIHKTQQLTHKFIFITNN
ncbi:hypothetical protein EAO30_17460 [Klebsiella pneumoniae]|nr:hypothetical protein EAO30_17460 [Klebsiella pneumoniae]